jgi:hypothetical protein
VVGPKWSGLNIIGNIGEQRRTWQSLSVGMLSGFRGEGRLRASFQELEDNLKTTISVR